MRTLEPIASNVHRADEIAPHGEETCQEGDTRNDRSLPAIRENRHPRRTELNEHECREDLEVLSIVHPRLDRLVQCCPCQSDRRQNEDWDQPQESDVDLLTSLLECSRRVHEPEHERERQRPSERWETHRLICKPKKSIEHVGPMNDGQFNEERDPHPGAKERDPIDRWTSTARLSLRRLVGILHVGIQEVACNQQTTMSRFPAHAKSRARNPLPSFSSLRRTYATG